MKTCLIVNPRSGGWERWQVKLHRLAAQTGTRVLSETTARPLADTLAEACRGGCRRLIVAGGDGTLSRIANIMATHLHEIELAVIPTGTGNDLARSIGIYGESLDNVWQWAVSRPAVPVDLIKVTNGTTHFLVNSATAGFGGVVSTDVTSDEKHRWGAIAYWMTAFARLTAALDEFDIRLELDSETISLRMYGLAIANGRYVGGGFPVAPAAVVNDGLLDVTTVPVLPGLELLSAGVDFTLGRHQTTDHVRTFRSSRARIHAEPVLPYSLDGEPTRGIDATFEVVPASLQIVCGPRAVALQSGHKQQRAVVA